MTATKIFISLDKVKWVRFVRERWATVIEKFFQPVIFKI